MLTIGLDLFLRTGALLLFLLEDHAGFSLTHVWLVIGVTLQSYHESTILLWFARVGARLFSTFGVLALFLAAVGIYGVKAYLVSLRTGRWGSEWPWGPPAEGFSG